MPTRTSCRGSPGLKTENDEVPGVAQDAGRGMENSRVERERAPRCRALLFLLRAKGTAAIKYLQRLSANNASPDKPESLFIRLPGLFLRRLLPRRLTPDFPSAPF
jgi:hypothetical protein